MRISTADATVRRLEESTDRPPPSAPVPLDALSRVFEPTLLAPLLGLSAAALPLAELRRAACDPAADILRRPGKRFRARLVELGWQLSGATGEPPPSLAHAIELVHAGSMVIDDIEDGSTHRRGEPALHRRWGVPLALNTGNLLYFVPLALFDELELPDARALELHRRVGRTMLRAHCGQALDLGVSAARQPQAEMLRLVRAISELKTGSLTALAATVGGVVAGAPRHRVGALERFGTALGVALQMLDDAGNLRAGHDPHKRYEDLRRGRSTWVWAWLARALDERRFARLQRHAAAVQEGTAAPAALAEHLHALLGEHGRNDAHAHLAAALAALRTAVGPTPVLDELAAECARLEASYG